MTLQLFTLATPVLAQPVVEFDAAFLRGSNPRGLDTSRYTRANPVPPGEYESDIYLNNEWKGTSRLVFRELGDNGATTLCLNNTVLAILDLLPDAVTSLPAESNNQQTDCFSVKEAIPNATINYRLNEFRLDVTIAQAYIRTRPRGYISPHNWRSGVTSAFLNYDYQFYQTTAGLNQANITHYLNLNGGINVGNWHYRHHGSMYWGSSTRHNDKDRRQYHAYDNYLQRDIPALRSQFTLGDFTSTGSLFDALALRGVQLQSDERMLPDSMRGYAPSVRGVAHSNARVTIRQNTHIIYETTVPPGPFEINDLYTSGHGSDLFVTITEADGAIRTFTVPFNTLSQLLRPGQVKYQIAIGRYRFGSTTLDDRIAQASLQYGMNNWLTVNTGVNSTRRYHETLIGGAFNTPLGAFGLDLISARSTLANGIKASGLNWRAHYSQYLDKTRTNISVTATRYAPRGFNSIQNALLQQNKNILGTRDQHLLDRQKSLLQLTLNQPFGERWGSAYLSAYSSRYWNHRGRNTTIQAGYSNHYRSISYTLSFSRTRDDYAGKSNNTIFVNFSIPLDHSSPTYLTTQAGYTSAGNSYASSMLSGTAGVDNAYAYNLSASHDAFGTSGNINGTYHSSYGSLNLSAGIGKRYRQISAAASGAVIAHPKGISFSQKVGDTFAIISAPGAQGARITSGTHARLDRDGLGIVTYLNPYHINSVEIDPQGTGQDVDFDATSHQVIPRANSAMLIELKTRTGVGVLFQVTLPDGSFPPLGAQVLDEKGNAVGFVAQQGFVFTRGPEPEGRLQIRWGSGNRNQCKAPYVLIPSALSNQQSHGEFVRKHIQCQ